MCKTFHNSDVNDDVLYLSSLILSNKGLTKNHRVFLAAIIRLSLHCGRVRMSVGFSFLSTAMLSEASFSFSLQIFTLEKDKNKSSNSVAVQSKNIGLHIGELANANHKQEQ